MRGAISATTGEGSSGCQDRMASFSGMGQVSAEWMIVPGSSAASRTAKAWMITRLC